MRVSCIAGFSRCSTPKVFFLQNRPLANEYSNITYQIPLYSRRRPVKNEKELIRTDIYRNLLHVQSCLYSYSNVFTVTYKLHESALQTFTSHLYVRSKVKRYSYSTTLVISSQIARESFRRRISVTSQSSATAVTVTNCYS